MREFTEQVAKEALHQAAHPQELVYWLSPLGDFDDFGRPYGEVMYDARIAYNGVWANMNQESYEKVGCGRLGTGWGQKYRKQADGRWLKVEG